jgi:hypothetical protein
MNYFGCGGRNGGRVYGVFVPEPSTFLTIQTPYKVKDFFFRFSTLEDGTDRLSKNIGKQLPVLAA